jgi:hypothetical protein
VTTGASLSETGAHIQVLWANAIGAGELSCCYDDPATGLQDAWTRALEQWNNTKVSVSWHPSHAGIRRREQEYADHPSTPYSCACGTRCSLPARFKEEEDAEITAAVASAGITPMPQPGLSGGRHLVTLPGTPDAGLAWLPGPDVLTGLRRGAILGVARHVDMSRITSFTTALGSGLDGTVTVRPGTRTGGTWGRIARIEFTVASPLTASPRTASPSRPRPPTCCRAARPGRAAGT